MNDLYLAAGIGACAGGTIATFIMLLIWWRVEDSYIESVDMHRFIAMQAYREKRAAHHECAELTEENDRLFRMLNGTGDDSDEAHCRATTYANSPFFQPNKPSKPHET